MTAAGARRSEQAWATEAFLDDDEAAAVRHLLLVAEALEQDVAWHSPARFQVAANIARDLLTGARAKASEQLLYEQNEE